MAISAYMFIEEFLKIFRRTFLRKSVISREVLQTVWTWPSIFTEGHGLNYSKLLSTAWKIYLLGVFLVPISRIRTEYGSEKLWIQTLFMQCSSVFFFTSKWHMKTFFSRNFTSSNKSGVNYRGEKTFSPPLNFSLGV